MRIRSFQHARTPPPAVNIVMIKKTFHNLPKFEGFVDELLSHKRFNASEPHIFMFSELPFPPQAFFERSELSQVSARISGRLAASHPRSTVVFTANQARRQGKGKKELLLTNSAYWIHAKGHATYAKRNIGPHEKKPIAALGGLDERFWEKTRRVWRQRDVASLDKKAFPEMTIGGKKFELKICADSLIDAPRQEVITLVPATNFAFFDRRRAAEMHSVLFINDPDAMEGGRQIIADGGISFSLDLPMFMARKKYLQEFLRGRGLKLHLVG